MQGMNVKAKTHLYAAVVLLICLLTGCIVAPVPMTRKTLTLVGPPQRMGLHVDFVQVGQTPRSEVCEKLASIAAVDDDRFFLGRWAASRSGWVWAIGGGGYGGAGVAGAAGGWRTWKIHNLIVEFDDRGVVSHMEDVSDQQLVRKLVGGASPKPHISFTDAAPLEIEIQYLRWRDGGSGYEFAQLVLSPDVFALTTHGKRTRDVRLRPADVIELSRAGILNRGVGDPDPNFVEESLHFSRRTFAGKSINFKIKPSELLALVDYLQQNSPAALEKRHSRK